jgi:hypothetical protein
MVVLTVQVRFDSRIAYIYESGSFRPDDLFAPGRFTPGRFAPESESIRPT